jgi:hypothetical protein
MNLVEKAERIIVRMLATNPAGHNLYLIGSFRYRFLDGSIRFSSGVDFYWEDDLTEKQAELLSFFQRQIVPEVSHRLGYQGRLLQIDVRDEGLSPTRVIALMLSDSKGLQADIVIPITLTRVVCLDSPAIRTMEGVVYPTISDADMIETTVLSLFHRKTIDEQDLFDLFFFERMLVPHCAQRIVEKMVRTSLPASLVKERYLSIVAARETHLSAIQEIIDAQLDPLTLVPVKDINAPMVFERVCDILQKRL